MKEKCENLEKKGYRAKIKESKTEKVREKECLRLQTMLEISKEAIKG